jgi:hypothetical protein
MVRIRQRGHATLLQRTAQNQSQSKQQPCTGFSQTVFANGFVHVKTVSNANANG